MSTEFVKSTLRENLSRVLVPHVADGLWSVYDAAKAACDRNGQTDQILKTFQNLLTQIPKWSPETLDKEVKRIATASKCEYMEDLLLGVFVSYIRAFATLQQVEKAHVEIDFKRPSIETFVHQLYKQSARQSWSSAYLFKTVGVSSEQQARNRREIESLISDSMNEVIDSFIPWKDISKAYFQTGGGTAAPVEETPAAPTAPAAPPAPVAPKPALVETAPEPPKNVQFDSDDEEDEDSDDEPPAIALGEDATLNDSEFDDDEDDESVKLEATETVSLNL
jgi:Family of unknown function (DUF5764)